MTSGKVISRPLVRTLLVGLAFSCANVVAQMDDAVSDVRARTGVATVDANRIGNADAEANNWLSHGRDYAEQRYSPLTSVSDSNVDQLGLAWVFELPTRRGQEATPIVVDGVMYITGSWSQVFALDAVNGKELWRYDPMVPRTVLVRACCGAVNRGVAIWKGRVYFGTLDGRLIALNAEDGSLAWEVMTVPEDEDYTITGAPRIVRDKVIIGNGGAEFGVRGYVSAYDVGDGALQWRFFTVPGDPSKGFENEAMREAAKTWTGEWWRLGGGGTVWDSMAYDPELNLLYVGVGNGSPWNRKMRSPDGGDNWFLSSIVALNPDTGEYVWHFQTTPAENWDYTATQHMILADITIKGELRQVIMQAPKNGFFYVLDRRTGEFLSAENFVPVNWASHVNPETGRPVETTDNHYFDKPKLTLPSPLGGHNWMPMSYSPDTGLVYIPAMDAPHNYGISERYPSASDTWRTGTDFLIAATPLELPPQVEQSYLDRKISSHLLAWDPVAQKAKWKVQHAHPWNGGTLATAGNLVFQGDATGYFSAYAADTGVRLWEATANTGIVAAPMTYSVDGVQYVAVLAGWGGAGPLTAGRVNEAVKGGATGRMLAYRLDATGLVPPVGALPVVKPKPPRNRALDEDIKAGFAHYSRNCGVCHGPGVNGGGVISDLRYLSAEKHAVFEAIVYEGVLAEAGMPGFSKQLTKAQVSQIHAYIIYAANKEYTRADDARWWRASKRALSDIAAWLIEQGE